MTARLSDEELSTMKMSELIESYRMPKGEATDNVDRCIEQVERHIHKKRHRAGDTILGLILIPLAVPLFTIGGFLMGLAAIVDIIRDLWNMWVK